MPPFLRFPGRGRTCRPRSGAHARREVGTRLPHPRLRKNVGEGLKPSPTGQEPKVGHGALVGQKLRATGHRLVTITTHQALRTTNHVPRTNSNTRVCPYEEMTHHEPQATSHKLLAAVSSFQRGEPLARASRSRPARFPSLVDVAGNIDDDAGPPSRPLTWSWTPAFAGVTEEDTRGDRGVARTTCSYPTNSGGPRAPAGKLAC